MGHIYFRPTFDKLLLSYPRVSTICQAWENGDEGIDLRLTLVLVDQNDHEDSEAPR